MNMKKFYIVLFAFVANFSFVHAAVVDGTCGENLTWSLNTSTNTLTIDGTGDMTSCAWYSYKDYVYYVTISEGVTSICQDGFRGHWSLKSITIPSTITKVGEEAFNYCDLTSVYINDLAKWSAIDFADIHANPMYTAENIYIDGVLASKIVIPDGVTVIGNGAFCACHLDTIIMPNSITKIGNYAFYSCRMTSITIPDNVSSIGDRAFQYCNHLTDIVIPDNVTNLGNEIFINCTALKEVSIGNGVINIGNRAFKKCDSLRVISMGSGVESIGYEAFWECEQLSSLTCKAVTPPTLSSYVFYFVPRNIPVFVPAESVDTYKNTIIWEEFNIRAIGSLPLVEFVDWDGTILSSGFVEIGSAAIPPANPSREGYTFIGWDKDFSNVTDDMTITAQYKINRYKVEFVDWDNTILKSDSVDWNTAAVPPSEPYRKGYTFKGWDKEFEHVTYNLTIKAQYEMGEDTDIVVKFTNGNNGNEILRHSVTLKVPEAPEIEGFSFLGWQPISKFIEEEIEIQAIYKSDTEAVPDVYTNPSNPSQKLIREGNVYILHGEKVYTVTGQEVK